MRDASPLRYPGGKWRFAHFFERLIALNFDAPPIYAEPYAGGCSLALSLLFSDQVAEVFLNDLDPAIHAFWISVLRQTNELCELIASTPVTRLEWQRQKEIYTSGLSRGELALGFAMFFLNRTNHSGILNGGMIGGKRQLGEWKLDARFNRPELIRRIRAIAGRRHRIHLSNQDAIDFVRGHSLSARRLIYMDPPYYGSGGRLYMNAYGPGDHATVRDRVVKFRAHWVVSYDDAPQIRKLYSGYRSRRIGLLHTARTARQGREILFFSPQLRIPVLRS